MNVSDFLRLGVPRAPEGLPVAACFRKAHGVADWKLLLNE